MKEAEDSISEGNKNAEGHLQIMDKSTSILSANHKEMDGQSEKKMSFCY